MWMNVLEAAGVPVIGDKFPLDWEGRLKSLNPGGFYESSLRDGINFTSNPHPNSGEYLHPAQTKLHAVKVFAEGVVQTDLSFLDRVVVSVRPWRDYVASIDRLHRLEAEDDRRVEGSGPPRMSGALEWWRANFGLIRDVAQRHYAVHFQSWPALLAAPAEIIPQVLAWVSDVGSQPVSLNIQAAVDVVDPSLAHRNHDTAAADLDPQSIEVFDALFDAVHQGGGLPNALLDAMNETHQRLEPRFLEYGHAYADWMTQHPGAPATLLPLTDTGA